MKKGNETMNKSIHFIEVHEKEAKGARLINVNAIEAVVPIKKYITPNRYDEYAWIRCSNWRSTDGLYILETYEEVKELIQEALS